MASIYSRGQKIEFSESYGTELVNKIFELFKGIPISAAKGVLRRVEEEIDHVSVINDELLSERHEYDTNLAANILKGN